MKKILFVPTVKKNNGTGHLTRTIKWAKSDLYESFIYIPESSLDAAAALPGLKEHEKSVVSDFDDVTRQIEFCEQRPQKGGLGRPLEKYDMAVFDMRTTDLTLFREIGKKADILVAVDEGGEGRNNFDYLIDTLPNTVSKASPPNIFSTDLLGYEDKRFSEACDESPSFGRKYRNILISFGGEDAKGITEKFLEKAHRKNLFTDANVTVVLGPLFKNKDHVKENFGFYNIVDSPPSLQKLIEDSDLVFTSFGLTAYEALYAGKDVILINPAKYHRKLTRIAGFCEAGIINPNLGKIEKIIKNPALYKPTPSGGRGLDGESQSTKIEELFLKAAETEKNPGAGCPVCKGKGKIYKRYIHKNYLQCKSCGIVYLQNIGKSEKTYDKSYFFEEYKNQYGKTYIEDFDNISAISQKRADVIKQIVKQGRVLDIGCAYGPFLNVMRDQYECCGIDICEEAVEYVNKELGIKAIAEDITSDIIYDTICDITYDITHKKFDIITMWYVIEHFKNPGEVLEKVKKLICKSGLFAFSTPNLSGISGLYNKNKFLESSPSDHYTIWNISSAKHILRKFGFKVCKVRNTGHHPKRFPLILQKIFGLKILGFISRVLRLGDTFEIYAELID
ncbi:MAG: methyltransferase domain-containing protein [Spirochaetes bacterium]|nr:methyltransferase domain-containing protein [Spirochaetota bacterium]